MVSPLGPRRRAAEKYHGGALALDESRAAPVRSGWAEATQRGRGNGGKVVRKRGRGMKICRVKYYVDFGGFFIEKRAYAPLRWNHLEHEETNKQTKNTRKFFHI